MRRGATPVEGRAMPDKGCLAALALACLGAAVIVGTLAWAPAWTLVVGLKVVLFVGTAMALAVLLTKGAVR